MNTRARKRFGQNFLTDPGIIDQIITAINPGPDDHILEIGPGRGALTEQLSRSGCRLTLIEIDRDLVASLQHKYPQDVTIHSQDVLKFDFTLLASSPPIRVVGNLPYNISTPLLFRLFASGTTFRDFTFMLQLEVVKRIVAEPSTSGYGRLSIMSQYFCDPEMLFEVPPTAFTPAPKVNSAIIRLTPRMTRNPTVKNLDVLEHLLITAFSKRRKTVRNAMSSCLSQEELLFLNIDTKARPENLTPAEFIHCANFISTREG